MENSLSIAVIPRGGDPFISELLAELNKFNPQELLVFNIRPFKTQSWAPMRHIWTKGRLTQGELVNIAVQEAKSSFVFVLWSDMRFLAQDISAHVFLRIEERADLCAAPQLYTEEGVRLPALTIPAFDRQGFRVVRSASSGYDEKIFSPLDFAGIYNRARFLNLGGFDGTIENPYWQKNDFAMRAALWGERMVLNSSLAVSYLASPPVDDESFDLSSRIFALKSLAVQRRGSTAFLPLRRFLWLWGVRGALHMFREIKAWVQENRYRFRYDAERAVDHWSSL